jgi:hypothetical protein
MSAFQLTSQATEDLDRIWWFIAVDNQEAADRLEREIIATSLKLFFPNSGSTWSSNPRVNSGRTYLGRSGATSAVMILPLQGMKHELTSLRIVVQTVYEHYNQLVGTALKGRRDKRLSTLNRLVHSQLRSGLRLSGYTVRATKR